MGEVKVTFEDETNKTTEEKALEKLNEEAYDDLIAAMEDKVAFSKVNQAKTKVLKGGCTHMAWKNGKYLDSISKGETEVIPEAEFKAWLGYTDMQEEELLFEDKY